MAVAKKAAATKPEVTEEVPEATEAGTKPAKKAPKKVFVVVEALPDNPKRGRPEGFGTSKWVKFLADFVEEAPAGSWCQVYDYGNPNGARLAKKNIEDNPQFIPDGVKLEIDVRRYDVDEEVDGETKSVRHSGLYLKWE